MSIKSGDVVKIEHLIVQYVNEKEGWANVIGITSTGGVTFVVPLAGLKPMEDLEGYAKGKM